MHVAIIRQQYSTLKLFKIINSLNCWNPWVVSVVAAVDTISSIEAFGGEYRMVVSLNCPNFPFVIEDELNEYSA